MRLVIAAAGTGGHVVPALTVAETLVSRGMERNDIVFAGGDRFEAEAVPAAGFGFEAFELIKLERSLSVRNLTIPAVLTRTSRAMARAFAGAEMILGMSGYVTVPAAMAARRLRLPFALHEQNAAPGLAARLSTRNAVVSMTGFPKTTRPLRNPVFTGNPLRSVFKSFERSTLRTVARRRYEVEDASAVVGVVGGSQGARAVNRAIADVAAALAGSDAAIVHLAGPTQASDVLPAAAVSPVPWRVIPYEDQMDHFYAACDLIVARAGAMTVSEVAVTGTPAVFVPLEVVRQQDNANYLVEGGAAEMVRQDQLGELPAVVAELIADAGRRDAMASAARTRAVPDAAERIAAIVEAHL